MTKRECFEAIREYVKDTEYVEFIDQEIAAIDARAEKERERRAAKRAEGDALKDAIKAAIDEVNEPITAEEIADRLVEDYPGVTKAKVTYRASALVKDGEIDKCDVKIDKRKVVAYAPAGSVETEE